MHRTDSLTSTDTAKHLGAIHKLRHTNFMIFLPLPRLVTGGHISETPSTYCDVTYFAILNLEIIFISIKIIFQ